MEFENGQRSPSGASPGAGSFRIAPLAPGGHHRGLPPDRRPSHGLVRTRSVREIFAEDIYGDEAILDKGLCQGYPNPTSAPAVAVESRAEAFEGATPAS